MSDSSQRSVAGAGVSLEDGRYTDVYRTRWQQMVRFAALTTGSVSLAEEIVQDAFADTFAQWDSVENPTAYVRRAVASRCTSWVRRRQLERRADLDAPLVHHDEHLVELLDALKSLTHRQRAAVVLRYFEDLTESDIARTLDCRPGTVKSLLARARAQLKKGLRP